MAQVPWLSLVGHRCALGKEQSHIGGNIREGQGLGAPKRRPWSCPSVSGSVAMASAKEQAVACRVNENDGWAKLVLMWRHIGGDHHGRDVVEVMDAAMA